MRRLPVGILLAGILATTAHAQQKDAGVATMLGIVFPGGGQYYAEETTRGVVVTALTAMAVGFGFQLNKKAQYETELVQTGTGFGLEYRTRLVKLADKTPSRIGIGVGAVVWLLGAVDAPSAANRANAKPRVSALVDGQRIGMALRF
jgi:hypothetical protein